MEILENLSVINRDNGVIFTNTNRLDNISKILENSSYKKINTMGLFHLYAKKSVRDLDDVVLISSHVDCEDCITKCFTSEVNDKLLKGTYDNSITNAVVVYLMIKGLLPDNVIVSFTGDEEVSSIGARQTVHFIDDNDLDVSAAVVLDVTDVGWKSELDLTLENAFLEPYQERKIVNAVKSVSDKWVFVPGEIGEIPYCVDKKHLMLKNNEQDESIDYNEQEIDCFSFCIPSDGEMHDNSGIYVRKRSLELYVKALEKIVSAIS